MNIDENFYGKTNSLKLSKLIETIKIKFPELYHSNKIEKNLTLENCSTIEKATKKELVFIENSKYIKHLKNCKAGCIILDPQYLSFVNNKNSYIFSKMPRRIFAFALSLLSPGKKVPTFKSSISKNCIIKKGALIGNNVEIGDHVIIGENSVIGDGVSIGDYSEIGSNCSIYFSKIGKNSIIYSGVRIGTTGFGFNFDDNGVYKFPHRGRVIIKDNVEIGANSTIDRGSLGDTIINSLVMIDNLVHVAHNVIIGKGTIICGQSGIAGSTIIGDNVIIGAQVGIAGHLKVASGVILSARSGVTKDINNAEMMGGFPALPIKEFRKQNATLRMLTKQFKQKKKKNE